jgi:hypothetical protein
MFTLFNNTVSSLAGDKILSCWIDCLVSIAGLTVAESAFCPIWEDHHCHPMQ